MKNIVNIGSKIRFTVLRWSIVDIAQQNRDKLDDRMNRNPLKTVTQATSIPKGIDTRSPRHRLQGLAAESPALRRARGHGTRDPNTRARVLTLH